MIVMLPILGAFIGSLWFCAFVFMEWFFIPIYLEAAILTVFPFLITGFIHLDGFMDTSDALLSRRPKEEKLKILKDPHTGAFSIISLVIIFLMIFGSFLSILDGIRLGAIGRGTLLILVGIPVISRCGSALAIFLEKPLLHSQYHKDQKSAQQETTSLSGQAVQQKNDVEKNPLFDRINGSVMGIMVIGVCILLIGLLTLFFDVTLWVVLWISDLAVMLSYFFYIRRATKELGGISGDLAGYALTLSEFWGVFIVALMVHWV